MKKNTCFSLVIGLVLLVFVASCKSAPPPAPKPVAAPPVVQPAPKGTARARIADRFYMSYSKLPCDVEFNDGTTLRLITDIRGTIVIPLAPEQTVVKLVYDFSQYKTHTGRVLAREDFKRSLKFKKQSGKKQTISVNLRDKSFVLLMLD